MNDRPNVVEAMRRVDAGEQAVRAVERELDPRELEAALDETLAVELGAMLATLWEAVQELTAKVTTLEAQAA